MGVEQAMPGLEEQLGGELEELAGRMQAAVNVETGNIVVRSQAKARHEAETEYPKGGDTYVEEKFEQHNEYHVPVVTPSETSKANREAARKLLGGVK
jgi:ABC-type nitrate/sulfonate/bicarbonate transport system substrate-binding protein